jgi:hypothetical protein
MTNRRQVIVAIVLTMLIGVVAIKPVRDLFLLIYLVASEKAIEEDIELRHGDVFDARLVRINNGNATVGFSYEVRVARRTGPRAGEHEVVWESYRVAPSRLSWKDNSTLVVVIPRTEAANGRRETHRAMGVKVEEVIE